MLKRGAILKNESLENFIFKDLYYQAVLEDSGYPQFIVHNGELYLLFMHWFPNSGNNLMHFHIQKSIKEGVEILDNE